MADRWNEAREQERRRAGARYGREGEAYERREDRSFRPREGEIGERRPVFGERESGATYGGRGDPGRGYGARGYGAQDYAGPRYGAGGNTGYGDRPYGERGYGSRIYSTGTGAETYQEGQAMQGGRYYGDDGRSPIWREEYAEPDYDTERYARARLRGPDHSEFGFGYDLEGRDYGLGAPRRDYERRYHERDGDSLWDRTRRFFGRDRDYERREDHRGRGPQGYTRSDERISEDVHERLTEDVYLDASQVLVTVKHGEVTLTGSVTSRDAKHRAEHIVEDLAGVRHVQNNLRVQERAAPQGATTSASSPLGENSKLNEQAAGKA